MAPPPLAGGKLQRRLLQAAADGNLRVFKSKSSSSSRAAGRARVFF
jgi:hypothetical protein